VFDFLRKKTEPEKRMSNHERSWTDIEFDTMARMKDFFEDQAIFTMFAGAVFALHQDTLRAYAIDMRKTDDALLGAAMDKMQPSTFGDFPKRVGMTMDAMNTINNMNLDMLEKGRPANVDQKEYTLHALMAGMRSVAARVWLLTIYSKVKDGGGGSGIKIGVMNMWMMLQMVPPEELHEDAKMFTGTFYNNIRSEPMNLKHWPQNS